MKALLAISLLLSANLAQAAIPASILEARRSPGYEMNPQTKVFHVDDTGRMTLDVITHRDGNKKRTIELGTLSEEAVRGLLAEVNGIDAGAKLIDEEEGKPLCTDTPSYSTAVWVKGQKKEISHRAGCHEWSLQYGQGRDLEGFARIFLSM